MADIARFTTADGGALAGPGAVAPRRATRLESATLGPRPSAVEIEPLRALQRRFHALVTGGAGDGAPGLLAGPDADGRAAIYRHMYRARLHGVLATDFPVLRAALGADAFAAAADGYLAACRPRSFTLRDLGDRLPGFLSNAGDLPPWSEDLARLEWARADVFDAPDAAPLAAAEVVASADVAVLTLALVPASAVVELRWDVDRVWSDVTDGAAVSAPTRSPRTVLVWRRGVRVFHRTLDGAEAAVIRHLGGVGTTFAALCAALAVEAGDDDRAAAGAAELLLRWVEAELLVQPACPTATGVGAATRPPSWAVAASTLGSAV